MSTYFVIDVYFTNTQKMKEYESYINLVKPIVESYEGRYLARSEKINSLSEMRKPDRVIIIQFPDKKHLEACFCSEEYKKIKNKREESVDARAVIVEGENVIV